MATLRRSMLGNSTVPDTSANVYAVPYSEHATNDNWKHLVWVYEGNSSTKDSLYGSFEVPSNYVGTAKFIVVWTGASTSAAGNVVWDMDFRAVGGNDTESLDQATAQESETVTDAGPSAIHERLEAEMTPTAGNFAADDTVEWILSRDGVDAADTYNDEALLFDLIFEYSDA